MKTPGDREEVLFREALKRAKGVERDAFLDGACGEDQALRTRLRALLQANESPDPFLEPLTVPSGVSTEHLERPPEEGPGTLIGRYKLLEKIGEGGFGMVYVAEQREPVKRRVALKIIKLGMDTRQVVARFEAERQALALMDHPNIAKVFDAGAAETGRPYFVMELVRGIPITKYCDQEKLATRARLDLFIQVCHAIQHAHQKGIIHRDIKPSNILVTLHDGVPVPKVIDFGIAKATQAELTEKTIYTQFQQFIGTPAYMSPEQAEMSGLDIDTRSDIYSLGVLLYELLTGSTPFDSQELLRSGLDEMRRIIREREPVRPSTRLRQTAFVRGPVEQRSTLNAALSSDLDWIVMKCLEKDRTRRYETANSVALDVERHMKNEPVVARPPSVGYRLQKSFRRNRVAFATAGAVGLALVSGVFVSTWQAVRATRAEGEQKRLRVIAQTNEWKAHNAQVKVEEQRRRAEQNLYAANMNLAQLAWEQNNGTLLHKSLEESADYPNRGFEWYYWQRQTHLELKALRGHSGAIYSVAVSPDGMRIVTGSKDRTAKVWDAASGAEIVALNGHSGSIQSAAFSPDGQQIVTGSADGTAKVWDAVSGKERRTLKGQWQSSDLVSAAFSPEGQQIVTCSSDGMAKVWDLVSGNEICALNYGATLYFAVSTNSQWVLTSGDFGKVKLWVVASHKVRQVLSASDTFAVLGVAFSPNGERFVTASRDQMAKVWETATGKPLSTLKGHSSYLGSAAFSPDGQRIVTGCDDQTAKVWNATTGKELFTLKGHRAGVNAVAFSPDGKWIVTGSEDSTAKVWDAAQGAATLDLKAFEGEFGSSGDRITSVVFSPDGRKIATGSWDRTARVWDAANGKELLTLTDHTNVVRSVAFSPDGRRIVTGRVDGRVNVWDAASGKELLTFKGSLWAVSCVAFSPDGQRIVTAFGDLFLNNGNPTAKVWDADTGRELLSLRGHSEPILSAVFSLGGQRIVTASRDRTAKVWDAASGRELLTLKGHSEPILSAAFTSDGQQIVTASLDAKAKVWDAASGKVLRTFEGDSNGLLSAAFSPDGQRVVTGCGDGTAKLWEVATGKELLTFKGGGTFCTSVAFSPDGRRICAGSEDGTTRVWEAATAQQVAVWRKAEKDAEERTAPLHRELIAAEEKERIQDPAVPIDPATAITATMDGGTDKTGGTWYELGVNRRAPDTGLKTGLITSEDDPASTYEFQPATGLNAVLLDNNTPNGTLTFASPMALNALSLAGSSGNGAGTLTLTLVFSDGTSDTLDPVTVGDWFNNTPVVQISHGRILIDSNTFNYVTSENPRVLAIKATLSAGDALKRVSSIVLSWTGWSNTHTVIFGVSGDTTGTGHFAPIRLTADSYNQDVIVGNKEVTLP
jgi:WD40 repeat protein/tRNA A-37 threonylcarbamoyl transferase component Bud32